MTTIHATNFYRIGGFAQAVEDSPHDAYLAAYASMYEPESGDTIKEFSEMASFEVYPARDGKTKKRRAFRRELTEMILRRSAV